MAQKVIKTDEEWRKELSPEQYQVLREKGTERAFTGKYYKTKEPGMYVCAACGNELFSSNDKFDSGTGWPSYTKPLGADAVATAEDNSLGMRRTEVTCGRCGSHLGHVFEDLPAGRQVAAGPEGKRFCINSCALDLKKK